MMRNNLLNKLTQLEVLNSKVFKNLEGYSNDELNIKISDDKWSITQILNHLLISEKLSLGYCKKKLSFQPMLKTAGIVSTSRVWIIKAYMVAPIKFKAPKGVDTSVFPENDTLDNIKNKWMAERQLLVQFIEELPEEYLNKEIYRHPLAGRLSIEGMLQFFIIHFNNHNKQIARTIKFIN